MKMSSTQQSNYNFFHLEKIFVDLQTFLLTVILVVLAYISSNMEILYVSLDFIPKYQIPPYTLIFSMVFVLIAAMQTRNFVPTFLVSIASILGMTPALGHTNVALIEVYLFSVVLTALILAWLVSKLRLISKWNMLLTIFFFVFGIWILQYSYFMRSNNYQELYWAQLIPVGFGGNGGYITGDFPLIDVLFFGILSIPVLVLFFRYRKQLAFSGSKSVQARVSGILLILLGQIITFVTLLWSVAISKETILKITSAKFLHPIEDLFTRTELFPTVISPMNVILNALVTTAFTTIGIIIYNVGKKGGTISGSRGGPEIVFLSAPLFTMIFIQFSSYPIQSLIYPGGYFIPGELFNVYFTVVWSFMSIMQLIAWVPLAIVSFFKNRNQV